MAVIAGSRAFLPDRTNHKTPAATPITAISATAHTSLSRRRWGGVGAPSLPESPLLLQFLQRDLQIWHSLEAPLRAFAQTAGQ
jgi:hypothetical protein